jgi:hypothetical protein
MLEDRKEAVFAAVGRLETLIKALPPDDKREKALYQLERLRSAATSSHQEAVRFAAFTINKTVHDASANWGAGIVTAMEALREALHAAGHEF